ncbi:sensor histidine kinase [Butyrivibrio sp. MC2013]|uniref:sensor histidine kinase n=1 Tax=Butyrivibrio sp. MC2013 TaxID=1280686 RepID=UPI00047CA11E|nr:histidine kinase [Butyrivibrio sp. MC2013]
MTAFQYIQMAFEAWATVFSIISAIAIYPASPLDRRSAWSCMVLLFTNGIMNIAEVFAIFNNGNASEISITIVSLAYWSIYLCLYIIPALIASHVAAVIGTRQGNVCHICLKVNVFFSMLGIILVILNGNMKFFYGVDGNNRYYRGEYFYLAELILMMALIPIFIQVMLNKRALRHREFIAFLAIVVMPFAGALCQMLFYGISFYNVTISLCLILLILVHQYEYTYDVIAKERQIADDKIRLYHSQIQPHFIYNCLTVIRSYLDEPDKAEEALNHFTSFLRGSMDMITETELIPAEKEFETVDNYLYMEKARFEDKLTVKKNLETVDFWLPVFTVQIMVENAVQHGIRNNPDGKGTVSIHSFETDKLYVIEVSDDGVGFVTDKNQKDNKRSHIGIMNIQERLRTMCGGSMTIDSRPGEGSIATVTIPKKGRASDGHIDSR